MHLQIHVTGGDADGSNGVLQVAAANGWPASNTDGGWQELDLAWVYPQPVVKEETNKPF